MARPENLPTELQCKTDQMYEDTTDHHSLMHTT